MLYGGGIFGLVLLGFWLWAMFDVITTDESLVRNLPKLVWLLLVVFLSPIGAVAWLLLGRPQNAGFRTGDTSPRAQYVAPEDGSRWDDEETRRARYAAMDEELDRRIEDKRLRELDDELLRRDDDFGRREQT